MRVFRFRTTVAAAVACAAIGAPAIALAAQASPAVPQVAECNSSDTYVWLADAANGATGHIYYPLEFTNVGTHSCWLYGYPGVAGLTAGFKQIGPAASRYKGVTERRVTLKPKQTVHATVQIVDKGFISGCHARTGAAIGVYPPNQKQRQVVTNFTFPSCTNKAYLSVFPVQSGIGVP